MNISQFTENVTVVAIRLDVKFHIIPFCCLKS